MVARDGVVTMPFVGFGIRRLLVVSAKPQTRDGILL